MTCRHVWLAALGAALLGTFVSARAASAQPTPGASPAATSGLDDARDAFLAAYGALTAADDEGIGPRSTTGARLRLEAAAAAEHFANLAADAIALGGVDEAHAALAWDDVLTTWQIAAALRLEAGDCAFALESLNRLAFHPEVVRRTALAAAIHQRRAEAAACQAGADVQRDAVRVAERAAEVARQNQAPVVAERRERAWDVGLLVTTTTCAATAVSLSALYGHHRSDALRMLDDPSRRIDAYEPVQRRAQRLGRASWAMWGLAATSGAALAVRTVRRASGRDSSDSTFTFSALPFSARIGARW